ncbi:MAG: type II secretion system F family protein [Parvibaculum sp.]|uniref:type II secretion system F family protein n=1 Tax=Parvibaculum sp. TaxID=2024848 RepID=UPI0025F0C082|nr:type II secretion system F family protein [Parvibaculum sp.]MCE9650330.1 type II secretion system F family protein [Parvibaculum sp.]
MTDPVFNGLIWIVAGLSAAAGALVLGLSGSALFRERTVASRLSALLTSGGPRVGLVERGAQWLEWIGHKIARDENAGGEVREALAKAGYFRPAALYIFLALRLAAAIAVFIGFLLLRDARMGIVNIAMAAIFAFLAYRYALIAVRYQGERRARRIQRELPPVLDIVLMVLDSGVSIDQCLQYVASASQRSAPTVAPVLIKHVADIESGVPYDAALDRLGQRLAVDEGVDFANLLKQAMFQGGELGPSLRRFSAELSDRRLARAREEGGRRSTYLTVVMVFFFVPVLMVILVGPAFVNVSATIQAAAHRAHTK